MSPDDFSVKEAVVAGRYRLQGKLGSGGMSTVMRAHDEVLERPVAIKLLAEHLADDRDFVMRFRHEALAVARLQHPNIVQVFDTGVDESSHRQFIVMELVEGLPLSELLRRHDRLDPGRAVSIALDACAALAYAHKAGIVHRDVKPANLLISDEGPLKLTDFGIAKAAEHTRVTQVGSVLGTAAYLSPEQAHGEETGPASDIYSLGVCVYQMLAGRLPHQYRSLTELAIKQLQEPAQPLTDLYSDILPALDRSVRAALNREPTLRYQGADEFARALRSGLQGTDDAEATQLLATQATRPAHDFNAGINTEVAEAPTRVVRDQGRRSTPPVGRTKKSRRSYAPLIFALMLIVIAAVAVSTVGNLDGGEGLKPVVEQSVQQQSAELRDFINRHAK